MSKGNKKDKKNNNKDQVKPLDNLNISHYCRRLT